MYLAFPSFQRTLYHRTKIISLYGLSSLGAIVFGYYGRDYGAV
jgi:hypothetical protein